MSKHEVEKEDQIEINEFSRLNTRYHDLEGDLKKKKEEYELLDDADLLVQESMGAELKLMIGEALLGSTEDQASSYVSKELDQTKTDVNRIKEEMASCQEKMKKLKLNLYSKFGTNINLEED